MMLLQRLLFGSYKERKTDRKKERVGSICGYSSSFLLLLPIDRETARQTGIFDPLENDKENDLVCSHMALHYSTEQKLLNGEIEKLLPHFDFSKTSLR
jgi:hypothetical protein